jgi:N-methylhydantoinase A
VTAYGIVPDATVAPEPADAPAQASDLAERHVWTGKKFERVAVLTRAMLPLNVRRAGPLVVEEYDSTTYVAPGWTATRQDDLLLLEATPR